MTTNDNATARAAFFGCTREQILAGYARNAKTLRRMEAKALKTGRKVGGYTAAQLTENAVRYEAFARGEAATANGGAA